MTDATASPADDHAAPPSSLSAVSADVSRRWPGFSPLTAAEARRMVGREEEIEKVIQPLGRPKAGQNGIVWLHGPAGSGKTSLIQAGICPALARQMGNAFHFVRVEPERGDDPGALIDGIGSAILQQSPEEDNLALDFDHRIRQFSLLHGQDPVEATEYLASCFHRSRRAGVGRSEDSICVVVVDEFDRFAPGGGFLFPDKGDDAWIQKRLCPVLQFLHNLLLTGCFPVAVAMRSLNSETVKSGLAAVSLPSLGSWIPVTPLELEKVRLFFEWAPADLAEAQHITVEPMLLDTLIEDGGGTPAGIPFVSETLRRLSEIDPAAESLATADAGWAGGVAQQYASAAEGAVPAGLDDDTLGYLMLALQKRVKSTSRKVGKAMPSKARYLEVMGNSDRCRDLVDRLVDARVLTLTGTNPERAEISWAVPGALHDWDRARRWLEEEDLRLETARRFDEKRAEWEKEERTPVLLIHASGALGRARDLLEHHRKRPFLSDEVIEYLENSLGLDEILGSEIRRETWRKRLFLYGGIGLGLLAVILLVWWLVSR